MSDPVRSAVVVSPRPSGMLAPCWLAARDLKEFTDAEEKRGARLAPLLGGRVDQLAADLRWLKYFDVLSLHLCMTGPDVPYARLPVWLRDSHKWSTAPDGTALELSWNAPFDLHVSPWPFEGYRLDFDLRV